MKTYLLGALKTVEAQSAWPKPTVSVLFIGLDVSTNSIALSRSTKP